MKPRQSNAAQRDRRSDLSTVSIMTLNAEFLWDGVGPEEGHPRIRFPWRHKRVEAERHMERIAEIVRACDPDLAVICEVENRSALERFNDGFLRESGYRAFIFEGDDVDTGQDVALLTRVDPDEVTFHEEAMSRNGVRKGLTKNIVAKVRVGSLRLGVIGVHLIANPDDRSRRAEREAQAGCIRELTRRLRRSNHLPVVCGDFNDYDGCVESSDCNDSMPISNVLRIARQMDPKHAHDDLVNASRFVLDSIGASSLDHFADPPAFMREAARIIKPDGRVVIALANFESLSCKLGRNVDRVKRRLGRPRPDWRLYWEQPEDHNVKGDLPYMHTLAGESLVVDRLWGISLLWLFSRYGSVLDRLPERAATTIWGGFDAIARRRPQDSDMIIAVYRKPGAAPWPKTR